MGMIFISWMLALLMLTGFLLIKIFELSLKMLEVDALEKTMMEMFLNMYYELGFAGRVNFILLHGSRFWAMALFGGMKE